jgi:3-phosphoshikimate 1-carboxyvinyltransferase
MEIMGKKLTGGTIDSRNDPRVAMSGALAAINAGSEITILTGDGAAKSYPRFFEDFHAIGGGI